MLANLYNSSMYSPELSGNQLESIQQHQLDPKALGVISISPDLAPPPANSRETGNRVAQESIKIYLNQIGKIPVLTKEQEVELALEIRAGKAAADKLAADVVEELSAAEQRRLHRAVRTGNRATEEFIRSNLRLVVSVAKNVGVARDNDFMKILDNIQEGNLGLMHAVEKFNPDKGFKFSTYATWWIRQAIVRGVGNQGSAIRLPIHTIDELRTLQSKRFKLLEELLREPTADELAEALGVEVGRVNMLLQIQRDPIPLDRPLSEEGDATLGDLVADVKSGNDFYKLETELTITLLKEAIAELNERQQQIINSRFAILGGEEMSYKAIGAEFGISGQTISKQLQLALDALRIRLGPDFDYEAISNT